MTARATAVRGPMGAPGSISVAAPPRPGASLRDSARSGGDSSADPPLRPPSRSHSQELALDRPEPSRRFDLPLGADGGSGSVRGLDEGADTLPHLAVVGVLHGADDVDGERADR